MRQRRIAAAIGVLLIAEAAVGQQTRRVSEDSSGAEGNLASYEASVSADGRFVVFYSDASNLVAGDTNGFSDVFVCELATGLVERVSVDSTGAQANLNSYSPSISVDGQLVAFVSGASNLVSGDTNNRYDIFVHDRSTGITERVSVSSSGSEANQNCFEPSISGDGQIVAFDSAASNLVKGDTNLDSDVFVHDRSSGLTERVSVDSSGQQVYGDSYAPSASSDGSVVAFHRSGSGGKSFWNVFVRDRSSGVTELVSVDSSGTPGNDDSFVPSISADGRIVAFHSYASNLVTGDTNGFADVFVRDRSSGLTERESVDSTGAEGNGDSMFAAISADGECVAYSSDATNLVAGDANHVSDIFLRDRPNQVTERASVDSSGAEGNGASQYLPSTDGRIVAFASLASNLVAGDANNVADVFVHQRRLAAWSNYGAGFPGTNGVPSFTSQADPVLGTTVTLDLGNSYGMPTDGLLFIGFQRTSIHSGWGGDLLVVPTLTLLTTFSYGGNQYSGGLPNDNGLVGLAIDLQAIEDDPGAAKGVSFSPGLELLLGR